MDQERPVRLSLRLRLSICVIFLALLIEAGFTVLFPVAVRFFIDSILVPRDRDGLYLLVMCWRVPR